MHPHGCGRLRRRLPARGGPNSPSAGLDSNPGGGRTAEAQGLPENPGIARADYPDPKSGSRAARGGRRTGWKRKGKTRKGVYMDGEDRGRTPRGVIRRRRSSGRRGRRLRLGTRTRWGGADLNDDDDDRGSSRSRRRSSPTATPTIGTTPTIGSHPRRRRRRRLGLLRRRVRSASMMRESQTPGCRTYRRGGHSRGADSSTSGDGGWGGSAGWGLVLPARDGFVVDPGKQTSSRGFSTPAGRAHYPRPHPVRGRAAGTVPPPMGAHDVTGGGTRTTSDAANAKEPPVNGSKSRFTWSTARQTSLAPVRSVTPSRTRRVRR